MQNEALLHKLYQLNLLRQLGYEYCDAVSIPSKSESIDIGSASLDELRQAALTCHLCNLAKGRKNVVFGEGDPQARLMIVGEGPGASEDEQGRPFVGRSGELLTQMIEKAIGISRKNVYIANVVKCRPPGNRNPEPDEMEACRPFLDKQIELVNPEVILCLGGVSFQALSGEETGITKARGKVYEWHGRKLIPSFHPSYLLRNPSAKKEAYADMLMVKELLDLKR